MELIAGSRIVKAQQRVHAAVPYSNQITEVVQHLAAAGASADTSLLVGRPEVHTACYVVVAADRGLCGGYNAGVLRAAEGAMKDDAVREVDHVVVAVGRKAESYLRFRGYRLNRTFSGFTDNPTYEDARQIAAHVVALYTEGTVDAVHLV